MATTLGGYSICRRRVARELLDLQRNPLPGIDVETDDDNLLRWNIVLDTWLATATDADAAAADDDAETVPSDADGDGSEDADGSQPPSSLPVGTGGGVATNGPTARQQLPPLFVPERPTEVDRKRLHLQMSFPVDYPSGPPTLTIDTYLPHPNVQQSIEGVNQVCLDMLEPNTSGEPFRGWSAAFTARSVLVQLKSLLDDRAMFFKTQTTTVAETILAVQSRVCGDGDGDSHRERGGVDDGLSLIHI